MQRTYTLSTSTLVIATFISVLIVLGFSSVMATQVISMPVKISYNDLSPKAKQQVECLAQNIYFESGHESKKGQIAVGMVTMNRVKYFQIPFAV
jgi:spore germination cell wall hydrolase CwlJ-like protein